jgi:hypothetical protein
VHVCVYLHICMSVFVCLYLYLYYLYLCASVCLCLCLMSAALSVLAVPGQHGLLGVVQCTTPLWLACYTSLQ